MLQSLPHLSFQTAARARAEHGSTASPFANAWRAWIMLYEPHPPGIVPFVATPVHLKGTITVVSLSMDGGGGNAAREDQMD